MKQLSVVIVNYNVAHFLQLCLHSVFRASANLDIEVIVVDNASSDTSCALVKQRFPEVMLIANKENVGFSRANNQGVAASKGEYVCILNPDTVVGEQVFDEVYAFAKANDQAGAIGVRLLDGTGAFLPECKRNLPTPGIAFQKLFGSGDSYYARSIASEKQGKVEVLVGAFMFLKKEIYLEAGGFDESYFMYGEDIDLSHTIEQLGYSNYYLGQVPVIHFKGESTTKDKVYRERFYTAMHIFYNKHLRSNFVEAAFINAGLWYAKKFYKTASKTQNEESAQPKKHVLVSTNGALQETLEILMNLKLERVPQLQQVQPGAQYLFDMTQLTYRNCIQYMSDHQDAGLTFKFIPKNSTFALGSNSSNGQGELLKW